MTGSLEALLIWAPILSVFGLAVAGGLYLDILRQPAGTGALQEMIAPGVTAVSVPPIIGLPLGKEAFGGMLAGAMLSGVLLALLMANACVSSRPGSPLPLNAYHSGRC